MDNLYPRKYFNDENIKHEASFVDSILPILKLSYCSTFGKKIIRIRLILVQEALIAGRISDWQIIMQQVRRYSRVLVCMYMSAKNSELSIVGL